MRLTLEPTPEIVTLASRGGARIAARVWTGFTDDGVEVRAFVAAVSPQTHDEDVAARFLAQLQALEVTREPGAIDFRYFID